MARDFSMVFSALWRSKRFRDLPTDDARLTFLYLLTNEHQNSAGCYRLLEGYACVDLGDWSQKRYVDAIAALVVAEMIQVDVTTSELMIMRWFKHCPPTNEKHWKGTSKLIAKLDSQFLREAAAKALNEAWAQTPAGTRTSPINLLAAAKAKAIG